MADTFPTYGNKADEIEISSDEPREEEGSITRVMLASEIPSSSLAQRTGAVTSIILPGDVGEPEEDFMEDDLADLLGDDTEDEFLGDVEELPSQEAPLVDDDDEDEDEDLLGLLDTIVSNTAIREPDKATIAAPEEVPSTDEPQETLPDTI